MDIERMANSERIPPGKEAGQSPAARRVLARRAAPYLLAVIVIGFLALAVSYSGRCLDDDAFISLRYARNLLNGDGLVYNPGERVEGYTDFAWVVLSAAAMFAWGDGESACQVFGILFSACILVTLFLLVRRDDDSLWSLFAPLGLVCLLPFTVETLIGLEMPLFVFLLLFGLGTWENERRGRPTLALATGLVFALAALTRPEAMLAFGLTFAADAITAGTIRGPDARRWAWRAAGFVALFLPYFVWRLAYYGAPLPNTFYAKTGGGSGLALLGLDYLKRGLLRLGPLVLLPLVLLRKGRPWRPRTVYAGLFVASYLVYLIPIGGDFRHHFRFFFPIFPFLLLVCAEAARFFAGRCSHPGQRVAFAATLAALVAWAAVGMAEPAQTWVQYRMRRNPHLFAIGEHLKQRGPKDALLAISGGGIVPFVSEMPAIEMWGLTDQHIARGPAQRVNGQSLAGHLKGDGAYILSRKPRYILFIGSMWSSAPVPLAVVEQNIVAPSEAQLWQLAEFKQHYLLRSFALPTEGFVNYFERLDTP